MSERDMSGRAIERAAGTVLRVKQRLAKKFPLGPQQVKLTPAEFRASMQQSSPEMRALIIEKLGAEKYLELMAGPTRPAPMPRIDDEIGV